MTDAPDTDEGVLNETSTDEIAETAAAESKTAKSETTQADTAKAGTAETATTPVAATKVATVKVASDKGAAGETEGADSRSAGGREAAEPHAREANNSRTPWWQSVRAVAVLAVLALVAAVTFGVLWATDDSADQLSALQSRLDTEAAAETAASQYALRVSEVDYRDLDAWRKALTDGVTEQLAPKLEAAVDVVGPWLSQMEYTATARLLAADVSESDGDRFVVQVFVDMTSKSKQTPDGVAATATYTVTMDRASNWTITDVGGVGGGLPGAGAPGSGGR